MLVLSEFVGCSPSVSGAIRVNPWNVDAVADGIYAAVKMPLRDRHQRHAKHWRYVSQHTVKYWAQVPPPPPSPLLRQAAPCGLLWGCEAGLQAPYVCV